MPYSRVSTIVTLSKYMIRSLAFLNVVNLFVSVESKRSYTFEVLKPMFEKDFNNTCSKYDFVNNHYERLTNNENRKYVVVNFNNATINGGFGDRIAELVTAVGVSIRFNRTLVFRRSEGFDLLFRPYIPLDIIQSQPDVVSKYTYRHNSSSWNDLHKVPISPKTMYNLRCHNAEYIRLFAEAMNKAVDPKA